MTGNDAMVSVEYAARFEEAAMYERLQVGRVDDSAEHEADRVADSVVQRLADDVAAPATAPLSESIAAARSTSLRRSAARVDAEGGDLDATTSARIQRARPTGTPLPVESREPMERAFGSDLSGVRIHTGTEADELNDQLQARAFTVGNDVFFRGAQPDLATQDGQHLLAHELAHTMQQGAGRAQRSALVRRMPSATAVRERSTKKEKTGFKVFGRQMGATNTYNAFLASIEAYDAYKATKIAARPSDIANQLASIHRRIDAIVAAAQAYLQKKDADQTVVPIATEVIDLAFYEKRAAGAIASKWSTKNTGGSLGLAGATWRMELPRDPKSFVAQSAQKTTSAGEGGDKSGQNKTVTKATNARGETGFFAAISEGGRYDERDTEIPDNEGNDPRGGRVWGAPAGVLAQYGMNDADLNLDNRSIAMSRLDQLLNAGMLARTEAAYLGDKTGTFQVMAKGKDGNSILYDATDRVPDDANFARLLSRMQLIDAIAGQIDRHPGNYFVQRDSSGRVTGVTGIDLDMAWLPTTKPTDKFAFDLEKGSIEQSGQYAGERVDHFPGFSKFVDKELAERIIALKPEDLQTVLMGLITPDELAAALQRLGKLKILLLGLQARGQLLEPTDWTATVRADILTEDKSYYAKIVNLSRQGKAGW